MIDLHLHTEFSDGKITNIEKIVDKCDIIALTDHNSILACKHFSGMLAAKKMIIGCEVTVDRAPDYLVYFPESKFSYDIESDLETIRKAEENVIKYCYTNLGYTSWDVDIERAFSTEQKIKNARTRDLAAIIHLYKKGLAYDDGRFDPDDLRTARNERWTYAEKIGNPIPEYAAFEIADKYNGKIVLAHPIHTAIKRCRKDNTNASTVKEKLLLLLTSYANMGGQSIEWGYFSNAHLFRYGISFTDIQEIRKIVMNAAETYGFSFTIGSDSHSLDNYDDALNWLRINENIISSKLANWIQ